MRTLVGLAAVAVAVSLSGCGAGGGGGGYDESAHRADMEAIYGVSLTDENWSGVLRIAAHTCDMSSDDMVRFAAEVGARDDTPIVANLQHVCPDRLADYHLIREALD